MNKQTLLLVIALVVCLLGVNVHASPLDVEPSKKRGVPQYSKRVLERHLTKIPISVDYKLNKKIRNYIKDYTLMARGSTERILGKTMLYFPIIEHFLDEYNLPVDLKALPIIESALNPSAKSHVGAKGLWQFMPATARDYGLVIDDYVDERCDPYKATEAAMKHLSMLYDQFEDWTLAIAAYNCGHGRVLKAMKKGKSNDFWKIKKHLPKETQDYVQRYIAANYVMNYYIFYDLHPRFPDYNMTMTETLVYYDYNTFQAIQKRTGISKDVLESLNPGYVNGIIPPNEKGSYIIIPIIGRSEKNSSKGIVNQ